jgi:hypothetical protein
LFENITEKFNGDGKVPVVMALVDVVAIVKYCEKTTETLLPAGTLNVDVNGV